MDKDYYSNITVIIGSDEGLITRCAEVRDFGDGSQVRRLAPYLAALMKREGGVGIAANQAGVNIQLFVTNIPGDRVRFFVNPVVAPYGQVFRVNEGCLSYPGKVFHRKRHQHVRVDAFSLKGSKYRLDTIQLPLRDSAKMLLAVAIQHENDHIHGRDVRFDN
jgi:peptide deformylase